MNTTIKLLIIAAASLVGLSACNQDNERAFYDESAPPAYSFRQPVISAELTPDDNGILQVGVTRTNAAEAATVAITLTASTATAALFTLATTSVSFEAGAWETVARVEFTLDNLALTGTQYQFTLEFNDPATPVSAGGNKKTDVKASRRLTWVNAGTGQWTDGLVCAIFQAPAETYDVSVQRAEEAQHYYRLVNPYGFGVYPYTEAADVVTDPCYVIINAINASKVLISESGLGIDWGYGEIFTASTNYGSRSGDTVTFPVGALGVGMRNYNGGNLLSYAKECVLVLPAGSY
jgi:hypothetical protein